MQIDIRGQNIAISGALAAHCLRRLERALRPSLNFGHLSGLLCSASLVEAQGHRHTKQRVFRAAP
jgi:hypothetical protein